MFFIHCLNWIKPSLLVCSTNYIKELLLNKLHIKITLVYILTFWAFLLFTNLNSKKKLGSLLCNYLFIIIFNIFDWRRIMRLKCYKSSFFIFVCFIYELKMKTKSTTLNGHGVFREWIIQFFLLFFNTNKKWFMLGIRCIKYLLFFLIEYWMTIRKLLVTAFYSY